jgi:hypothetical protein
MPGHIGTEIVTNSRKVLTGSDANALDPEAIARTRQQLSAFGMAADQLSDAQIQAMADEQARRFRDDAPTSAAQAAKIILDGVKAERWRILVGEDAQGLDRLVRADPEGAYEPAFFERMSSEAGWRLGR